MPSRATPRSAPADDPQVSAGIDHSRAVDAEQAAAEELIDNQPVYCAWRLARAQRDDADDTWRRSLQDMHGERARAEAAPRAADEAANAFDGRGLQRPAGPHRPSGPAHPAPGRREGARSHDKELLVGLLGPTPKAGAAQ